MDVEVVEHLDQEKSKLLLLGTGKGIEQVAANAGDVGRGEATVELPPFRCEACVDTTAIFGGAVASDQPTPAKRMVSMVSCDCWSQTRAAA